MIIKTNNLKFQSFLSRNGVKIEDYRNGVIYIIAPMLNSNASNKVAEAISMLLDFNSNLEVAAVSLETDRAMTSRALVIFREKIPKIIKI